VTALPNNAKKTFRFVSIEAEDLLFLPRFSEVGFD
jgi:hypothetical protein